MRWHATRRDRVCLAATASRELDAAIGKSIFPALADLEELEPGIWRQQDGNRVRR